jgi:hypothetical protein
MQILKTLQIIIVAIAVVQQADPQKLAERSWLPATYQGLTIGVSTKEDVLRVLGKPKSIGKEQDTGLPTMTYVVTDPVPGVLTVYVQKGILDGIGLTPKKSLTKGDIIRLFGPNYIIVHYATDDCLDDGGAAPIYENPRGSIKHMEYRDRGVAASFAYDDDQKVEAIVFTSKPFGPSHSICAARAKKK